MDNTLDIITVFNPDNEAFEIRYDNKSYGMIEPGKARRMPRFLARLTVKHLTDQVLNKLNLATNNVEARNIWLAKIVIDEEVYAMPEAVTPDGKLRNDLSELNRKSDLDRILEKRKVEDAPTTNPNFAVPQVTAAPNMTPSPLQPINEAPITVPVAAGETPHPTVEVNVAPASVTPSEQLAPAQDVAPIPSIMQSTVASDLGISAPAGNSMVLPEIDEEVLDQAPQAAPSEVPAGVDPALATAPISNGIKVDPTREDLYAYATNTLGMALDDAKTKAALDGQDIPQLKETLGYESAV
mgnify:CR=1 FL=1